MTGTTSFITSLASAIEANAASLGGVAGVWLFGSAITSREARDVDLLVIYRTDEVSPDRAGSRVEALERVVAEVSGLPAHVVLLSEREAEETAFAAREGGVLLYSARA